MGTISNILKVIESKALTKSTAKNKTFKKILEEELKKVPKDYFINERR